MLNFKHKTHELTECDKHSRRVFYREECSGNPDNSVKHI